MKEENIEPVFRQNESGRIYGITFIDYNNRCVLNGSRMGKEFSANVFDEKFKHQYRQERDGFLTVNMTDTTAQTIPDRDRTDFAISLFPSLFEQHGEDFEEEQFRKKVLAKRKRGWSMS